MKNQTVFWLLLLAVLNSARAQIPAYFLNGGDLQLRPNVSVAITSILWKHEGDLLAEWIENNVPLTYYGEFNGRTALDIKTGQLEINNTNEKNDRGLYTLEINNKVHGQSYNAKPIIKVTKPSIWIRPVACDGQQDNCTLICEGATDEAEPVTYTWWMDAKMMKGETKELIVFKAETKHAETFTCTMKNPVSEEVSDPMKNPFFDDTPPSSPAGTIVGVIIPLLIIVGGMVVGYLKRDTIKAWFCTSGAANTDSATAGKEEKSTTPADQMPLNNGEGGDKTNVAVEND